jgi:hypothetical protein
VVIAELHVTHHRIVIIRAFFIRGLGSRINFNFFVELVHKNKYVGDTLKSCIFEVVHKRKILLNFLNKKLFDMSRCNVKSCLTDYVLEPFEEDISVYRKARAKEIVLQLVKLFFF